jgi:hypothetical protein
VNARNSRNAGAQNSNAGNSLNETGRHYRNSSANQTAV